MDGAKGEDYFSWSFKVVMRDMNKIEDVIKVLKDAGYEAGDEIDSQCQDDIYFK